MCRRTCCTTKVDYDLGIDDDRLQAGEKPVSCNAVDKIRVVEAARRTIKVPVHVSNVKRMVEGQDGQMLSISEAEYVSTLCVQIARNEEAPCRSRRAILNA